MCEMDLKGIRHADLVHASFCCYQGTLHLGVHFLPPMISRPSWQPTDGEFGTPDLQKPANKSNMQRRRHNWIGHNSTVLLCITYHYFISMFTHYDTKWWRMFNSVLACNCFALVLHTNVSIGREGPCKTLQFRLRCCRFRQIQIQEPSLPFQSFYRYSSEAGTRLSSEIGIYESHLNSPPTTWCRWNFARSRRKACSHWRTRFGKLLQMQQPFQSSPCNRCPIDYPPWLVARLCG